MPPTRVAIIGDYGRPGEPAAAVAELVHAHRPDLVITTGDNTYIGGSTEELERAVGQYYHRYMHPYRGAHGPGADRKRFFPVLGNHDWDDGYPQPLLDYFELPGRYYTVTWGPMQIFAVSSHFAEPDGYRVETPQARWLQAELAASTAPWRIVVMHHPPYSSGHHGPSAWMRWPYADWGANVVLAGHDHIYERLEIDGVLYLVNGLGGGARYALGESPEPGSQATFNADHGALLGEVSAERLTLRFLTRSGDLIDEVTR
ncbi:MAG: metallophosphoesterase [Chloroflexi bacterium OHK40]